MLSPLLPRPGKFFPQMFEELVPSARSKLSRNVTSPERWPFYPFHGGPVHFTTSCRLPILPIASVPLSYFSFSVDYLCFHLPECKIHEGRDLVACSQLCPPPRPERWLTHVALPSLVTGRKKKKGREEGNLFFRCTIGQRRTKHNIFMKVSRSCVINSRRLAEFTRSVDSICTG